MKKITHTYYKFVYLFLLSPMIMAGCGTLNDKRVMARVGDDVILEKEVNDKIPLSQLQKKELTQLIVEKLLEKESKKQGVAISNLLSQNVYQKIKPVHQKDMKKYFEKNKDKFKKMTFKEAHELIKDLIHRERKRDAFAAYYNQLIEKGNVRVFREDG